MKYNFFSAEKEACVPVIKRMQEVVHYASCHGVICDEIYKWKETEKHPVIKFAINTLLDGRIYELEDDAAKAFPPEKQTRAQALEQLIIVECMFLSLWGYDPSSDEFIMRVQNLTVLLGEEFMQKHWHPFIWNPHGQTIMYLSDTNNHNNWRGGEGQEFLAVNHQPNTGNDKTLPHYIPFRDTIMKTDAAALKEAFRVIDVRCMATALLGCNFFTAGKIMECLSYHVGAKVYTALGSANPKEILTAQKKLLQQIKRLRHRN